MAKQSSLTILFFLFFSIMLSAQRNPVLNDKDFLQSQKLIRKAERLWKDENYKDAEQEYNKAIELVPVGNPDWSLGEAKMKIGDVKGGNIVLDKIINSLLAVGPKMYKQKDLLEQLRLAYQDKADNNFKYGNPRAGISATIDLLELFNGEKPPSGSTNYMKLATEAAFFIEDLKSLIRINAACKELEKNMTGDAKFGEFMSNVYSKILEKKYDEAEEILTDVIKNKGGFTGSRDWAELTAPYLYLDKGDIAKLEISVETAVQGRPKLIISRKIAEDFMNNFYGFIALSEKKYQEAIEKFSSYINLKGLFGIRIPIASKFKYYSLRAEAYEGLKEFEKAKKDYEASLVYYPEYEPALNGLARLEGRVITERLTDKIPPQIIITEPLPARGIIIEAAGNEVMIKGIATDPGGLKSVTINGEKVYSQEGGTFWGNAVLKDGSNKVTIIATDFSGNNAEKIIEVERPVGSSTANAVPVKEGKNFALLIGCQNYDDNSIPSLEDPIPDAIKLKLILKNSYNFSDDNVFTLFNPERSDFKKKFLEIYEVIQPEDNLVIFYAGHGIWVDKDKKGYWMLTDAKLNDVNTWLPNKEVLDMIARVPARHTLLITDACFSGSVFRTRGLNTDMPTAIQKINEKISRVAITSGNDTEVPDKSVFMKYLVKALSENKEKYMTAQKMFINQIIEAVMTETKTEPRYGTLELAGHVGGDYIFIRK